jgi:hypothetical protein
MEIPHPVEWELALASSVDEPCRCTFSDREYQRLDVRWRPLKAVPDMAKMLEKHRQKTGKEDPDTKIYELTDLPEPWFGLSRKTPDGTIVHTGRFFADSRLLVEMALVWPGRRDINLEHEILLDLVPQDPHEPIRHWKAMGMEILTPAHWILDEQSSKVGKVRWTFQADETGRESLVFTRYAMVNAWLGVPIHQWLEEKHTGGKLLKAEPKRFNDHQADSILWANRRSPMDLARGLRPLTLELAWRCPTDERLYHLQYNCLSPDLDLELPAEVKVVCCQPIPSLTGGKS